MTFLVKTKTKIWLLLYVKQLFINQKLLSMKTRIGLTEIVLLLSFLTVQVNAQDRATNYAKHESTIKKHNDRMFEHAKILQKEAHNSDDLFNRRSSQP